METLKERTQSFRDEEMRFSNYRALVVSTMIMYNDREYTRDFEVCVYVDGILHRAYYNIFSEKEMNRIFYKSVKNVLKIKPAKLDIDSILPF